MYFSRTPGAGGSAGNGGRMILNEVMQQPLPLYESPEAPLDGCLTCCFSI